MTEQLPLERLALWVEKRPDAAWLSQPVKMGSGMTSPGRKWMSRRSAWPVSCTHSRHFILLRETWTVDNGCMTPTMKIRRNVVEARFVDHVSELDTRQPLHWQ
jgi:hypothetical protein